MRTYLPLLFILTLCTCVRAQNTLTVSNGTTLNGTGGHLTLHNTALVNNGTVTDTLGNLTFSGTASDTMALTGSGTTLLRRLVIDRDGSGVKLGQDISVRDSVQMITGVLELDTSFLTLGYGDGLLVGETEDSYVTGSRGGEIGITVPSFNDFAKPGNLGFEIGTLPPTGITTVARGNVAQTVDGIEGIQRYFAVDMENEDIGPVFKLSYRDGELNGLEEATLDVALHTAEGWSYPRIDARDPVDNKVTMSFALRNGRYTLVPGGLKVAPVVLLEGPYAGNGHMAADLSAADLLPATQPYTDLGFDHTGEEFANPIVLQRTGDFAVVDWVFLELRAADGATVIATQAALLRVDGQILDASGSSAVSFRGTAPGDYHLVVRHRNHLGVMTASTLALTVASSTETDFTLDPADVTGGANALKANDDGFYLMIAGDANRDGEVNAVDINAAWQPQNGQAYSYPGSSADVNLDGTVNAVDYNLILLINNSLVGQLPGN